MNSCFTTNEVIFLFNEKKKTWEADEWEKLPGIFAFTHSHTHTHTHIVYIHKSAMQICFLGLCRIAIQQYKKACNKNWFAKGDNLKLYYKARLIWLNWYFV